MVHDAHSMVRNPLSEFGGPCSVVHSQNQLTADIFGWTGCWRILQSRTVRFGGMSASNQAEPTCAKRSIWPLTRPSLLARLMDPNDQDAWRIFQDRYGSAILTIARKSGLCEDEAKEVLAHTVEAVWQSFHTYDPSKSARFRNWLAGIVRNRIHEQIRQRPKHEPLPEDDVLADENACVPGAAIAEPEAIRLLAEAEEADLDRRAWDELKRSVPCIHWQVLHELLVHGLTGKEVAERLGLSRTNVYVIKTRTKPKLERIRARLAAEDEPPAHETTASSEGQRL